MHIPDDILRHIFVRAAADSLLSSIRISHVCRQWRLVAVSISQLWNHFDYSMGIWVAQLQMSRVSPSAAISVRISHRDLDSDGHSARGDEMDRWSILKWLIEAEIISFPRWNALYLELPGDAKWESVVDFFDMLSYRDDELDSLAIRITQRLDKTALGSHLVKLRFRPRHFHLDGITFPVNELARSLNRVESIHHEGVRYVALTSSPKPIILQQLSRAIFNNATPLYFFAHVEAPSLTILSLINAVKLNFFQLTVRVDLINEFAPGLQHLQIIDKQSLLLLWMVPLSSLPNLLTLHVEQCQQRQYPDGEESLVRALISMNMSSTFPVLQKLTLQHVLTPPLEVEGLLQSLPASTAAVTLIECPQSDTISVDLMRATHDINLNIQLCDDVLEFQELGKHSWSWQGRA